MEYRDAVRYARAYFASHGESMVVLYDGSSYDVALPSLYMRSIVAVVTGAENTLSISPGNVKTGSIPSFSFPPPAVCGPRRRPCYDPRARRGITGYCMKNMYLLRSSIRRAWSRNWTIYMNSRALFWAQIEAFMYQKRPRHFRWWVGGDIPDQRFFDDQVRIAERFPETRFLQFTKTHADGLDFSGRPSNMSVVLSMWPGWSEMGAAYNLPRAWLDVDDRRPEKALHCHGRCDECGGCWELYENGLDVVLKTH